MLGFQEGLFYTGKTFLDGYTESGSYEALHRDRKRFTRILYVYHKNEVENLSITIEKESLVYIIGFYDAAGRRFVSVHNDRRYFDGNKRNKAIMLETDDMIQIAERSEKELMRCEKPVQSFSSLDRLDEVSELIENESCLHKINRGPYVKVPPEIPKDVLLLHE